MTAFYLDPHDSLKLKYRGEEYEADVRQVFEDNINPGDIVVDVGAHIGWHTVFLSQLVGKDGQVFAFEPEPVNFTVLEKNVSELDNVVLENKAVSDANEEVRLYLSEENSGDHRIYKSGSRESVTVESVRLDDYFGAQEIALVKIDIQGTEVEALRGMKSLMDYKALKLIVEFWPHGLRLAGYEPEDMMNLLDDYRFRIFDIHQEHQVNLGSLVRVYGPKQYFTNLFCTRQKVMLRWLMK